MFVIFNEAVRSANWCCSEDRCSLSASHVLPFRTMRLKYTFQASNDIPLSDMLEAKDGADKGQMDAVQGDKEETGLE